MSYCQFIKTANESKKAIHKEYHDTQYGFPIHDDSELFARLILEINQAGLSWETILKKEGNFRKAFYNFDIKKIARYIQKDFDRLMNDAGIIRNRLKINATIQNAKTILNIQKNMEVLKYGLLHIIQKLKKNGQNFSKDFCIYGRGDCE